MEPPVTLTFWESISTSGILCHDESLGRPAPSPPSLHPVFYPLLFRSFPCPPSLLPELARCELASYPHTRRSRMSCLRLATHRMRARVGMAIPPRNLSPVPTRNTMTTHSWCVGPFRYQPGRLNDVQRTVRCSVDRSVRGSMSMVGFVVHSDPDRHRSLPSIQSTVDTKQHPSFYPSQSKPPISLPLVGKFLQVKLTIRFAGMLLLTTPRQKRASSLVQRSKRSSAI